MSDQENSNQENSKLYNDFEKRFSTAWFSSEWNEAPVVKKEVFVRSRKDEQTLMQELEKLKEEMETICEKQIRLANLAKFYNSGKLLGEN